LLRNKKAKQWFETWKNADTDPVDFEGNNILWDTFLQWRTVSTRNTELKDCYNNSARVQRDRNRLEQRILSIENRDEEMTYTLKTIDVVFNQAMMIQAQTTIQHEIPVDERVHHTVVTNDIDILFVNDEARSIFGEGVTRVSPSMTVHQLKMLYAYKMRELCNNEVDDPVSNALIIDKGVVYVTKYQIRVLDGSTLEACIVENGIPLGVLSVYVKHLFETEESSKLDLYNEYRSRIAVEHRPAKKQRRQRSKEPPRCPKCNSTKVDYDSVSADDMCISCGHVLGQRCHVDGVQGVPFSHQITFMRTRNDYQPIMHLRDLLAAKQATESTQVADDILDDVDRERIKCRKEIDELTHERTRKYLQELSKSHRGNPTEKKKYADCYEHIPQIIMRLGGPKPVRYTEQQYDRICRWFIRFMEPFRIFCPKDKGHGSRKNLLNYNYMLRQIHMLEWYYTKDEDEKEFWLELAGTFPLLKDKQKLFDYDALWVRMACFLNVQFFPVV
jgi:transcription initiation factor TFIIIB Brf1 subunit/transcription initiation factor TFIIB